MACYTARTSRKAALAGSAAMPLYLLGMGPAIAAPVLGPAYGDHMVVQRGQPVVISGTADPRETVTGILGGETVRARAGANGAFTLTFAAHDASEAPLALQVDAKSGSLALRDILVGDVYLCSGQSNMEYPVKRALNSEREVGGAGDDGIRLLMVPKATAPVPQAQFSEAVSWKPVTSESVADFSATCYFMGRKLRADHSDVPIGLIHSNWGGSAARAWLTPASVQALYGSEALDLLQLYDRDPLAATRRFVPQWYDWWTANDGGREPWTDTAQLDWKPVPQISFWNEWKGSGLDTNANANVWLKKTVTLTREQAAKGGLLSIGSIDDMDLTWVNGQPVGYTFGWGVERHYPIPADLLREGENEILIAANNSYDTGGFFAGPEALWFEPTGGARMPIGEGWEYSIGTVEGVPPRAPWDAIAGVGVMHNQMIAPLGTMPLAGVAWYQGESDAGQADYDDRLTQLFAGWRRQFGAQTRMLVVQLANYGEEPTEPAPSGWGQLRAEQVDAVAADRNAALVSAIDIGEPTDIHPANKQVLGLRLAMAAEGEAMPMPRSAVRSGNQVTVTFDGLDGGLKAHGGPTALGFELCGTDEASCRYALPTLQGDTAVLTDESGSATRVRYAWADAPVVNLYDGRGVPVPGFELPID